MPQWQGWYDSAHPEQIPSKAQQQAWRISNEIGALPPGKRVVFLRWILRYESYTTYGADPLYLFENGGLKISRNIMMLRPFGRELRRRGLTLDGIWTDNEGGYTGWNLTQPQLAAIYSSPRARANMPPGVKALSPEMFIWSHPNFQTAMTTFNNWALLLMYRAIRRVLVDSGIFRLPAVPGGPPVQPPTMNFNVSAPTWRTYDCNGWPNFSFLMDYIRSSSPGLYLTPGNRYAPPRVHHPLWNALIDHVNAVRSCMTRAGAVVWPTITWPSKQNAWVFEQMIAHLVRTGMNWTAGNCGYIYWRDVNVNTAIEDPLMVDIFNRHDQPFPAQRNLPEIPMDVDSFTTAGYTTTYQEFLDHV
ncbi:MAG TPA: hypothetical protein PKE29_03585 [Phycisphaerales bacterium]|nr:hypothetical protein [Phycisphaerales bacterium]